MEKLILIITLFLGVTAHAQTASDIRNDESYKEMIEKHIAFSNSDEYSKHMDIFGKFVEKTPEEFEFFNFKEDASNFEEWISERIDDSGFESVEDAVTQYKTLVESINRINVKQAELDEEMRKVRKKFQDQELFRKVFMEDSIYGYNNCIETFTECRRSASDAYASEIHALVDLKKEGTRSESYITSEKNKAMDTYMNAVKSCVEQYHICNGSYFTEE